MLVPQLAGVVVERVERLADRVLITATAAGAGKLPEVRDEPGAGAQPLPAADAPIAGAPVVAGWR